MKSYPIKLTIVNINEILIESSEFQQVHLPKTAKIFFQKSTKSDSSEGKSKIKSSLFGVIKSDKSKSSTIEKCSPAKAKSDGVQLAADLAADEHFINQVNQNGLNKVKKSSSFSSTTSLATSSTSSDNNHVNSTNKENDCELNNLISEFSDSFNALKGSYIIHPNVISNQANSQNGLPTRISLNPQQQQFDATPAVLGNSPPKPPSRAKSTSKSNKQREESVNSSTVAANSQESGQHPVNPVQPVQCATIQITGQPSEKGQTVRRASQPAGVNFSEHPLNGFASQTANKLTISVQANDKNDGWFSDMKSELILNGQPNTVQTPGHIGLWSSAENDLNKSKRSKSVKQLKFSEDARNKANLVGNKSSMIKRPLSGVEQPASKSNTMDLDLRLSMKRLKNSLLDKRDLLDKQSRPERAVNRSDRPQAPDRPRRSIDESVNELASKSISRLAGKSLGNVAQNLPQNLPLTSGGTVRNKSCSSLYRSSGPSELMTSSLELKKSRIPLPLSRSSITLGDTHNRRLDRTSIASPVCRTSPVLTDNCLEVPSSSSSSFCSLCSSISDDSLDKPNKKPVADHSSSLTSSLSNLNSSMDSNFESSRMRASHSMSKINQRLESLMSTPDARRTNNYPFRDGTRSMSNLTSYTISGYTNRRLLKTTSNHVFQPIRELSRIEESLDDDQQVEQAKQSRTASEEDNKLDSRWLDYGDRCIRGDAERPLTNRSTNSDTTNTDSHTNYSPYTNESSHTNDSSSSTTFSPSEHLHGMDDSAPTNTSTNHASSSSTPVNSHNIASSDSASSPVHTSTNRTTSPDHPSPTHSSSRPSLNQFKSSLINQLIDSNSHLKSNLGLDNEPGEPAESEERTNDEVTSLNETEKNIFSSKKSMFAKNRSLMSKTDSCKSFELNEKIVDLEMQLTSHKQKFNESLNLIKLLSDHCNDLIDVFNENYNCKLKQVADLLKENQRLIKLNDEYKMENLQLNETCDDLSRHLNQQLSHPAYGPAEPTKTGFASQALNQHLLEQYKELEEQYGKLKSALDYSRENETRLADELNTLKIKFHQNHELYERVKSKALEKVER